MARRGFPLSHECSVFLMSMRSLGNTRVPSNRHVPTLPGDGQSVDKGAKTMPFIIGHMRTMMLVDPFPSVCMVNTQRTTVERIFAWNTFSDNSIILLTCRVVVFNV